MILEYTPLKLRPCYKEYLWGGERLKKEYGKADAPDLTAESWELSCHRAGMSVVAEGPLAGKTLEELDRAAYWGADCKNRPFPILVKLIDAAKPLSVQVHPSDETAVVRMGERGKAEMWYIVDCAPQSFLYLGLRRRIDPEEFRRRAEDGTICQVLNRVPVARGDVFYILPGTIHAIGQGLLIAEIQQSSNTTFRVYDYRRRDAAGQLRPLHLDRAAEVMDYTPIIPEECRANSMVSFPGFEIREMFSCEHFRAYRVDARGEVALRCDGKSFQHLLCVEGEGVLRSGGGTYPLARGGSYFLPAALGDYQIAGNCRVLLSRI